MIAINYLLMLFVFFVTYNEPKQINYYEKFLKQKPAICVSLSEKVYDNQHLAKAIKAASKLSGLPDTLIDAVISVESGGDIDAVSSAGAIGPMQVMPIIEKIFPEYDRFDPYENIIMGSLYLASLYEEMGSFRLALAAYNYGPTDLKKNGFRAAGYVSKVKHRLKGTLEI